MYQVEKVHKQKSIELKKELLNFVFFSLRMRGEGIVSESQKSFSEGQTMDPNLVLVLPQRNRHRKVQRHCH